MDISHRLQLLMARHGQGTREVAAGCGVSYQEVDAWMQGGAITDEHLTTLAAFYGVSPAWLLGDVDELAADEVDRIAAKLRRLSPEQLAAIKVIVDGLRVD